MRYTEKEKRIKLFETQIFFEDELKTYWIKPDIGEENIALKRNYYDAINKLGQLEDIEEELGIDLIVLLKAVKDGVYVKHCYDTPCESIDYEPFRIDYWIDYKTNEEGMMICGMEIKDYGKTWALTKEELL